jgi:hypothetical protein
MISLLFFIFFVFVFVFVLVLVFVLVSSSVWGITDAGECCGLGTSYDICQELVRVNGSEYGSDEQVSGARVIY